MYGSRFPRAIEEAHAEDMSRQFEGGYVSDRTLILCYRYMQMVQEGSESDQPFPEAA